MFLLLSQKSLSTYGRMVLPLLPLLAERSDPSRKWLILLYGLYSTAVGVESMFYEDWIGMTYPLFLQEHRADAGAMRALSAQVAIDATIVSCELVWLGLCLRERERWIWREGPAIPGWAGGPDAIIPPSQASALRLDEARPPET